MISSLFSIVISSCSKDTSNDIPVDPNDLTGLIVDVSGIVDETEENKQNDSLGGAKASISKESIKSNAKEEVYNFDGFMATAKSGSESEISKRSVIKNISNNSSSAQGNKAAAMGIGIKYRVLLFNPDGSLFTSVQCISGTKTSIPVLKNVAYTWVAYSFNNQDDISQDSGNNPTVQTKQNTAMLYATGGTTTIKVEGTGNQNKNLNINFKFKTSRFALVIDATPLAGAVKSAEAELVNTNIFKTGTLNLKTGAISNLQTYYAKTLTYTLATSPLYPAVTSNSYYSAEEISSTTIPVKFNKVVIVKNGTEKTYSTSNKIDVKDVNLKYGNFSYGWIFMYEGGINVAGLSWAPYNLYYNSTDKYQFRSSHTYTDMKANEDYWAVGALTPAGTLYQGDPCKSVLPANTWRIPSRAEFNTLFSNSSKVKSGQYFEWTSDTGAKLRLYTSGYLNVIGGVAGQGTRGLYYTSDDAVLGTSKYALDFSNTSNSYSFSTMAPVTGRATIRCVKSI